jgi:thymidylate synthase
MNNIDKQYQQLLQDILDNGVEKETRNGETISAFGRQIRHKMSEGFPLLTTKKMAWKTMVTELLWFLRGDTNIKFLVDNGCHIWDGDAYKNYEKNAVIGNKNDSYYDLETDKWRLYTKEEFINKIKTEKGPGVPWKWGSLGRIYGWQWRNWTGNTYLKLSNSQEASKRGTKYAFVDFDMNENIDQIANLINELKTNPDSRRLMVSAWNVGELNKMVLPPCHYGFQVYTRELHWGERAATVGFMEGTKKDLRRSWLDHPNKEKYPFNENHTLEDMLDIRGCPKRAISLMWNQRSVDTFLGLPFNIASCGLLLEIIAKEVNMVPDELIGNLGDVHLYSNHIEQAKEQIGREPYELPQVQITERNWYLHEKVKEHMGEKTFSDKILSYRPDCFELIDYKSHPKIKAPLSN